MGKRVYISADYDVNNGDRNVISLLTKWGEDNLHKVDFIDTAQVAAGSVSDNPDCRACDLKKEFNDRINWSSMVLFIIGDKTKTRTAGSKCMRVAHEWYECRCTPYKHNSSGIEDCKYYDIQKTDLEEDVGYINRYSYLEHEYREAIRKNKTIVVLYNSAMKMASWLPEYMITKAENAQPFWIKKDEKANYELVKRTLGFE